jgi:hypothetical protein
LKILPKIGSFFRQYRNLRVIILCFLAATTFWFFNALNETYSASINYPISFEFDREEYVIMKELPEEVYINLQGIGWNLFRKSLGIQVTPLRIYLDNPAEVKTIPGSQLPSLISDQLDEFQLNFILTDSLSINIDRQVSRNYKVKIDSAAIELAPGHIINSKIQYFPDSIFLIGPATILNSLGDTILFKLPQNSIDSDYNEEVPITFTRDELIEKFPEAINIIFSVEEIISTENEVTVKQANFPPNATLADSLISITIEVLQSNFEQLNLEDIEVVADYRNFNSEDSTIIPRLHFYPGYIHQIDLDTTRLKVMRKQPPR